MFVESVVFGMLQDEKQRNLDMQEAYRREIQGLRKGSVTVKRVSGRNYYYLKYRHGKQVKNDYLGTDEEAVESVLREVEKRKYLQGVLKRLQLEYKQICKIVKD
jgi:hypothetical protein